MSVTDSAPILTLRADMIPATRKEVYRKLLAFIETNDKFGVSRLYGLTTSTGMVFMHIH